MPAKSILVVDDEPVVRQALREMLAFFGYEVSEAADGEEALVLYCKTGFDLVISDIYMPKLNGIHLLRAIRRDYGAAKVILMTGYSHFEQLACDEKSRPDSFFTKPFSASSLIRVVEQLIGTE